MTALRLSYEYLIRLLIGGLAILLGIALASSNDLVSLILWLSGLVYIGMNGFHFIISLFKWLTLRNSFSLLQGVFKGATPLNCLSYTGALIGKTLLHFIKFSFVTIFLSLARAFLRFIFSLAISIPTGSSSSSAWKSSPKKSVGQGFVEGQIVFCQNCGSPLSMGAIYDRSNPLCHRCWVC